MVRIRQPIFSILTASIFSLLALMYGYDVIHGTKVSMAGVSMAPGAIWALVGILFLMAYFAIVHIKD